MTALLASLLSLFVLVSAVDAATCGPEAATAAASDAIADIPGGDTDDGGRDNHAICAHGHCHHGGVTVPQAPEAPLMTRVGDNLNAQPLADGLPSLMLAGPDRPPRG